MLFRTALLALIAGATGIIAAALDNGIVPPSELTPDQYPADGSAEAYQMLVEVWEQRQLRLARSPNNVTELASSLTKRDSWDCNGSTGCSGVDSGSCRNAWERYSNNVWYNHYASRVSGGCAAMYHCNTGSDYGNGWPGWYLEERFSSIYTSGGCKRCGSCKFWATCRTTLNNCVACNDSG